MKTPLILFLVVSSAISFFTQAAVAEGEEKIVFETWSGLKIDAYKGSMLVPENRNAKDSRMIPVRYVRLPATGDKAGFPIVYLAGGPGGSGIMAINYRYNMFMALREYGDVIALDQRGTGDSNIVPECRSHQIVPTVSKTSDKQFIEYHRNAVKECLSFWKSEGADIAGYNTIENALDLDALRQQLGAKKVVLWGTSYGSHLALAALKVMDDKIDRVILSSAEGLDQTVKLPTRTDAYFDRLQAAINTQPEAKALYPDIKALIQRVHDKLDENPVFMQLTLRDGTKVDYQLQRKDMQLLATSLIADPDKAAMLLDLYSTLDQGKTPSLDHIPGRMLPVGLAEPGSPIALSAMATGMDIASGIDSNRKVAVAKQAKTALLRDYMNFSYHFGGIAPELDLGDDFRLPPTSDVPVLLLSGTLDGRTYVESQHEAVAGLSNVTTVTVENAGHNLFDLPSDAIQDAINRFMEGKPVSSNIVVELPVMVRTH